MAKFTQYLSGYGWRPTVLTVRNGYNPGGKPLPVPHSGILHIERAIEIDPVKKFLGSRLGGSLGNRGNGKSGKNKAAVELARKLYRTFVFPDPDWLWLPGAIYAGRMLLQRSDLNVSVIFSTSPGITNHLVAMYLKRLSGLPWVAEFRDYWAFSDTRPRRSKIRAKLEQWLEQRLCSWADFLISVSEECCQGFISKYDLVPSRVRVIHNGFDPHDFSHLTPTGDFPKFNLAHAGFFYEGICDPTPVFRALKSLEDSGEIDLGRVEVDFYGHYDSDVNDKLVDLGLDGIANWHGYTSYEDLLPRLCNTYCLFSIAPSEIFVNAKVFDYMGCSRPVIAIGTKGSSLDRIITGTGIGFVVGRHDEESMKRVLRSYWHRWISGDLAWVQASAQELRPYTRPYQAAQLAAIFDAVVSDRNNQGKVHTS